MYRILIKLFLAMIIFTAHMSVYAVPAMSQERQEAKTPEQVLKRLQDGNQRFVQHKMKTRNLINQAYATAEKQHPVAVILNCIDSRTPPEIIFDQGIGDIFAIRIAGNVVNKDILGSMEFGTAITGAKLIAVIGHTNCGAIKGACEQAKLGNLTSLLAKIQPSVAEAKKQLKIKDCSEVKLIDKIAEDNVRVAIKQIKAQSPVIDKLVKSGKIAIVGGVQDISTGKVTFF